MKMIRQENFNKTDRHDITEILLKVALNTNEQTKQKSINVVRVKGTPLFLSLLTLYNVTPSSRPTSLISGSIIGGRSFKGIRFGGSLIVGGFVIKMYEIHPSETKKLPIIIPEIYDGRGIIKYKNMNM